VIHSLRLKRPEGKDDQSFPSSAQIKTAQNYAVFFSPIHRRSVGLIQTAGIRFLPYKQDQGYNRALVLLGAMLWNNAVPDHLGRVLD
jgi:hypothetical protein